MIKVYSRRRRGNRAQHCVTDSTFLSVGLTNTLLSIKEEIIKLWARRAGLRLIADPRRQRAAATNQVALSAIKAVLLARLNADLHRRPDRPESRNNERRSQATRRPLTRLMTRTTSATTSNR